MSENAPDSAAVSALTLVCAVPVGVFLAPEANWSFTKVHEAIVGSLPPVSGTRGTRGGVESGAFSSYIAPLSQVIDSKSFAVS